MSPGTRTYVSVYPHWVVSAGDVRDSALAGGGGGDRGDAEDVYAGWGGRGRAEHCGALSVIAGIARGEAWHELQNPAELAAAMRQIGAAGLEPRGHGGA